MARLSQGSGLVSFRVRGAICRNLTRKVEPVAGTHTSHGCRWCNNLLLLLLRNGRAFAHCLHPFVLRAESCLQYPATGETPLWPLEALSRRRASADSSSEKRVARKHGAVQMGCGFESPTPAACGYGHSRGKAWCLGHGCSDALSSVRPSSARPHPLSKKASMQRHLAQLTGVFMNSHDHVHEC